LSPAGAHAPSPEQAAEFYDAMWRRYAHLDAVSPAAFHRRRLVVQLAARAVPSPARILDVGCGQGELLDELAARFPGARITGADISAEALASSRERSPGYQFVQLDLADPAFEEAHRGHLGGFDLVVCSEVLEHIADAGTAARRLFELVAPGGVAVVTVPGGSMSRYDVAIGHHRHYDERALARVLEAAGFDVERVVAWGFPFHSIYRTVVRLASRVAIGDRPPATAGSGGGFSGALGSAYALFGRALKPAFYFNLDRWGEQMLAVARRTQLP